jgi:hypothetical protein
MNMRLPKTGDQIECIVNDAGYKLIEYHIDKNGKIKVVTQDKTGYKYYSYLKDIQNGHFPETFCTSNPFSLYNIELWIWINEKAFRLCDDNEYINAHENLKFYCKNCDDIFFMSWNHILSGRNCAVCAGQQTGEKHSLVHLRPDLMEEWNYQKNEISPYDVSLYSGQRVWWVCQDCGYDEWIAAIANRTSAGTGCPACSNPPKVVTDRNRLSMLYPEISDEWHPTKNGSLTPNDVPYACNNKVWWLCSDCGNEWKTEISNRTKGKGCKRCASSKGEKEIERILDLYGIAYIREKHLDGCIYKGQLRFDFVLPDFNCVIEYNGIHHYRPTDYAGYGDEWARSQFEETKIRDNIKRSYCYKNNIEYIEISYLEKSRIEDILVNLFGLVDVN